MSRPAAGASRWYRRRTPRALHRYDRSDHEKTPRDFDQSNSGQIMLIFNCSTGKEIACSILLRNLSLSAILALPSIIGQPARPLLTRTGQDS